MKWLKRRSERRAYWRRIDTATGYAHYRRAKARVKRYEIGDRA